MRIHGFVILALAASGCAFMDGNLEPYYADGEGPSISGLDVTSESGNIGGGSTTISGSAFGSDVNKIVVLFGDKNAEITALSDSSITVTVPPGPVSAGKVAISVATEAGYDVFGDDDSESGYIYDRGPTYDDDPMGETLYDDENAYVVLQNYRDSQWASWVGLTGVGAFAEFLEFAYPRYHTQDIGVAMALDQAPSDAWVVQVPGQVNYIMGLEELRHEVDDFVIWNHENDGKFDYVDAESLDSARPADENTLVYERNQLHVCEEPWKDSRDKGRYSSEWPITYDFFDEDTSEGSDGLAHVTLDFSGDYGVVFADGSSTTDLELPPPMIVRGTEGFKGGTADGAWTLTNQGVGLFDACFDDDDDDDSDTTLDDVALRWEWEPLPAEFDDYVAAAAGAGNLLDVQSYVRINLTQLSIGWIGGESYPIRATLVVPDDNNYDPETGRSSAEMPVDVFYQFPTADVFIGGSGPMGASYDDPTDPRWGYTFVSVDRITEYRLQTSPKKGVGLQGDLVLAYATGDFGLFSYEHPLDGDRCGDCVDNDGDGWVDDDDPDCEEDYRTDGSDADEDGLTDGMFTCNDGIDNDDDKLVDSEDDNCEAGDDEESNCHDGIDNDGDGWEDELDGECINGEPEIGLDTWSCSDGLDNDADGWIDVDDPDCTDGAAEELGFGVTACNDGLDNDGHGDVDALDPYCFYNRSGAFADDEQPPMTADCANGSDDDGDGYIDGNDPDCETGSYYQESRTSWTDDIYELIPICYNGTDDDGDTFIDADDPGCVGVGSLPDGFVQSEENGPVLTGCENGADDDADGWVDADDPDCATGDEELGFGSTQCNDGVDNDADSLIDADDVGGCTDALDDDEEDPAIPTGCENGTDDDGDGWIDADDPDCASDTVESGYGSTQCNDGVDNDSDGLIDAADVGGCADALDDDEEDPVLTGCENTLDDDADGWIDADDPDCASGTEEIGFGATQCNDGLDNDTDTFVDGDDGECTDALDDDESL
ncbi:MAG: IPT/TIG domain-containing protein [Pseudomonadota bacterium]